ncbi:Methyl-accepting chemotaxis protein [Gulbenkiania indica]|uniref:Methyl-accepting chemotaxis protein n=2 Tax=Gulbenkiania TaxID=397456 RepID=A0A0K6H6F4_9NEIS|nr:methyl-accepting chemotaxis protein [Gulbenkiania indica]TCW29944.1 methyl-accepting chemotaxis protein [Gulbenkiania mobilis]CUA86311.1 Methyl-accepting chemotaxis protein [Gulbenkiania indica]
MTLAAIAEWFVPENARQTPELAIRARTVVSMGLLAGIIAPLFALSYFKLHHPAMGYGILLGGVCLLLGPFLLKMTGAIRLTAEFLVLAMYGMVCWMVYVNGGILSTSAVWFASIPFAAIFVAGRMSGMVWTGLTLVAIGLFFLAAHDPGSLPPTPIPHTEFPALQAKSLVGLSLVILALAMAYDRAKSRSFEKLEAARSEAEQASHAMQRMMEQVTRSIHAASSASREIAASTTMMARTMHEQRERAEEMVSAAQDMAVVSTQTTQQSQDATRTADTAGAAASSGGEAMDNAVQQINQASEAIRQAALRLEDLGEKSTEVSGIVQLIRGIADQTNLLALNAAIEAARAGELGRGFAVVADEVRKLAERTQQATLDIEHKIRLIVDGTNEAIVAMRSGSTQIQSGQAFTAAAQEKLSGVIDDTHRLAQILVMVARAEETQNAGFARFASNITAVGESTRSLSGETETIAQATRRLDALMADLGQSVNRFSGETASPA